MTRKPSPSPIRTPELSGPATPESGAVAEPEHLVVGHLSKVHGIRGEVFVWPLTDHPDSVFTPGARLHRADGAGPEPRPGEPALRIVAVRPFRQGYLVHFEDISTRTEAGRLVGRYLVHPIDLLPELEEDELFYHQLLGMVVSTVQGVSLGVVVEVYELEPDHLLEVRSDRSSALVPFTRRVVREIDTTARRILVDLPEGLLDL